MTGSADRGVLLSIVVPAYRVSTYLPECLGSLLLDAREQIDVVVVDDASPDSCGRIADDFADRDPRVRAVHLTHNVGLGPARNLGLGLARGDYVWFVDGDDVVPAGAVAAVRDRLAREHPDLLLLGHRFLADDGVISTAPAGRLDLADRLDPAGRIDSADRLDPAGGLDSARRKSLTVADLPALLRVRQAAWNRVVRRDLIERTGVRFPAGWYEDVVFSYLLLVAAERISALDDVGYLYRQRAGGITSTTSARHFEVFDQYEWLFDTCDRWGAPGWLRAQLFHRMIEHYLVILGADQRVPRELRPMFFAGIVQHYWRYLPGADHSQPGGLDGLKHWLIRRDSYPLFAGARLFRRVARRMAPSGAIEDRHVRCRYGSRADFPLD